MSTMMCWCCGKRAATIKAEDGPRIPYGYYCRWCYAERRVEVQIELAVTRLKVVEQKSRILAEMLDNPLSDARRKMAEIGGLYLRERLRG
jgi:hypothetical protein